MKRTTIESPDGLTRYHYVTTGNGRIKRTKYEGDMQGRAGDWNKRKPQTISFDVAKTHYRWLIFGCGWSRV